MTKEQFFFTLSSELDKLGVAEHIIYYFDKGDFDDTVAFFNKSLNSNVEFNLFGEVELIKALDYISCRFCGVTYHIKYIEKIKEPKNYLE